MIDSNNNQFMMERIERTQGFNLHEDLKLKNVTGLQLPMVRCPDKVHLQMADFSLKVFQCGLRTCRFTKIPRD